MAKSETNLADRSGGLVESHKGYDPRIVLFYFVLAAMLLTLASGLAYQQLSKTGDYHEREKVQNMRRVLVPGPRGNIYDRHGQLLATNKSRWTVVLHLDELKAELIRERGAIAKNFRNAEGNTKTDVPTKQQLWQLARVSVAQRYLDQVNAVLDTTYAVNAGALQKHFDRELLLPFTLVDGLEDVAYARLIERLPVNSPLDVYAVAVRHYPNGSAAAHTIGYVRAEAELEAEGFPGDNLTTFKMKNTRGRDGLELSFDAQLQGEAGGSIYRVDPSGYKINPPLEQRKPRKGGDMVTSLDIDMQIAAETTIGDQRGAAVAIEIATGEVLVMASKPDYDLNGFSPRATTEFVADMTARSAWPNLAMNGFYPPGSTFKILTSIAGLRAGAITPDESIVFCNGYYRVGNRPYPCDVGNGHHGDVLLREAIGTSCDVYYYKAAELMSPTVLAREARRFRLDRPTGIELPNEESRMLIPDPEWKKRVGRGAWVPGDTANISIGQGDILLSPLQMAAFTASVARGELFTKPTLVHRPGQVLPRGESIDIKATERRALFEGMQLTITHPKGTGRTLELAAYKVPGVTLAAKTGTAQKLVTKDGKTGNINLAWIICFAPAEKPEVAIAVMVEGDTIGEDYYGGRQAGPVASAMLKKYFERKNNLQRAIVAPFNPAKRAEPSRPQS